MNQALKLIQSLMENEYSDYVTELTGVQQKLIDIQNDMEEKMTSNLDELSINRTPEPQQAEKIIYQTPQRDNSFISRTSDIPSLPHFKTPLPKQEEYSFATNSSHSMPKLPIFRTPAAKYTPSTAMSSPNSIITPIKRKFDIKALPEVFQQDDAKDQVFLLHNTLLLKDKWLLKDLKDSVPLSNEKIELIIKVFSEKGFIQQRDDIVSAK